jgi:sugar O-acyltransferase (sialic acid O-acetyltransferase NeuD family)
VERRKLVLVGDSVFAQVARELFQFDSAFDVVAFAVERLFIARDEKDGLPVLPFEELTQLCPPDDHSVFVAIVFTQFNRLRARLYREAKTMGYSMASYVSSAAQIRPHATLGEHCFICEYTVVQPFAAIGNNVVIWSGNQICHRARIGDHTFILPNCIISDGVTIGAHGIVGANVTIGSDCVVGEDCYLGPATVIEDDVPPRSVIERAPTGMVPEIPSSS